MVNYACGFNQSETGKYFEWIITSINLLLALDGAANDLRPQMISRPKMIPKLDKCNAMQCNTKQEI